MPASAWRECCPRRSQNAAHRDSQKKIPTFRDARTRHRAAARLRYVPWEHSAAARREHEKHWKVQDRRESAVDAVVAPQPAHKKRGHARIVIEHFTNRGQIRTETARPCGP